MDANVDTVLFEQMKAEGLLTEEQIEQVFTGDVLNDDQASELVEHVEEQIEREAIYAAQENGLSVSSLVEPENAPIVLGSTSEEHETGPAPAAKPPKKAPKTPSEKRVARVAAHGTLGAYVARVAGEEIELLKDGGLCDLQGIVNGINAKKIQEKAANFFTHFHAGTRLSVFTRLALAELKASNALNMKRLVEVYQTADGKSYSVGTARSQAQQIVTLLRTLRVVKPDGTPNEASSYWSRYTTA
jgi:hypothetical protein